MIRNLVFLMLLALCAFPALGCSSLFTITMDSEEIHQKLKEKLPKERTHLHVKTIIEEVAVTLRDGSDRIQLRPSLVVSLPLLGSFPGQVSVAAQVRYAPDKGEFYLDDAVVTDLDMPRIPEGQRDYAQSLVALAAKAYLATVPVYRLKQDNFKHSLAKLMIKSVTVRNGKLVITLGT